MKSMKTKDGLFDHLAYMYGKDTAVDLHRKIKKAISKYKGLIQPRGAEITFNQKDTILITYPEY